MPQEVPRRISILDDEIRSGLVINRCLPEQRDGSRRWFEHFSSFLISRVKLSPCLEQPALFKVPQEDDGGALLMHVDDVLFCFSFWMRNIFCRSSCRLFGYLRDIQAASHLFSSKDTSDLLESSLIPVFRSILGAMLYVSHERRDFPFTTKCLAS